MPSSLISLATLAMIAAPAVATTYDLVHSFDETNFFQNFSFYTDSDPTDGFVQYLDYEAAHDAGMAGIKSGNVYLGVDYNNTYTTGGRPSTRVESNVGFNQGLLIADLAHMPGNACGVWPAFWTTGSNWPADGEIDIIEGINHQSVTDMVLHTGGKCSITENTMTGAMSATDCNESDGTTGCVVNGTEGSYGDDFNTLGGGVYAMEWTAEFIKIWFFPRSDIPDCITEGNPDPTTFGTPMGVFQGSCDFSEQFQTQKIIFNTDFCGDWAGSSYASSTTCPMSVANDALASCEAYVGANPSAFTEAYWEIVSVKIFEQASESSAQSTSSSLTYSATGTASRINSASSTQLSTSASSSQTHSSSSSLSSQTHSSQSHSSESHSSQTHSSKVQSSSAAVAAGSGSKTGGSGAGTAPTTSSCSSKSTSTVTKTVAQSSSSHLASTTSPCPTKSTVTVTSFTTSAPVQPSAKAVNTSSKLTTTTVVVTSYVDICPSGYTTKTITQTVTYCPADVTSSSIGPQFTTTSKFCSTGCGPSPTTVAVVVPVETSTATSKATGTLGSEAETQPALAASSATATSKATGIPGSGSGSVSSFETETQPALAASSTTVTVKTTGIPGSGSVSSVGAETLPALAASSTTATGASTASGAASNSKTGSVSGSSSLGASPVPNSPSNVRVPAAPSSATVSSVIKASGTVPGSGSVSTTAVSPAFTGAATRMQSSAVGLFAALAGFVLFI